MVSLPMALSAKSKKPWWLRNGKAESAEEAAEFAKGCPILSGRRPTRLK